MLTLILLLIIIFIFVLNYILPHLFKIFWGRKLSNWAGKSGKIFITFDDGPDSENTIQILDFLKRYKIQASFFVLGTNVQQYPDLFKRMVMEGHTIGIHGQNHLHPWKVLPWKSMKDLSITNEILKNYGIKANYVRPPYGKLNLISLIYILINHLIFVHWNLDPRDYKQNDSEKLFERLTYEIQKGKVVLLHDGRRPGTFPGNITAKAFGKFLENTRISADLFSKLPINGLN
jgi:peptidoglycan/xylan/chitin deacetylase (PgdA/CDA1 family)